MFVVLRKGSSYWGEWNQAFYGLQHPADVKPFMFLPPNQKNFRVERVKHFLMSSPCAMTMLIFFCWEHSEGEALMKHTLIRPVGVVSTSLSKGRILHISCYSSVFDEGMKAAFCDRQVSYICASVVFIFLCVRKKNLFSWDDKTRVASISYISPPSCSSFTCGPLCFYLSFLPCCVAVVHLQMNLAYCLAAAWCIVTFSNEPILMYKPSFLCAAPFVVVVVPFPSSSAREWGK